MAERLTDDEDTLIMSVRLRSGKFESSIEVPLFASEDEKKSFVESWLALMAAGIKCGQARRPEGGNKP